MMYMLEFTGMKPVSKKNNLRPVKRGDGKLGLMNDKGVTGGLIDLMCLQVPGSMRDLRISRPHVDYVFFVPPDYYNGRYRWDIDNAIVTVNDVLVKMGVIADDSVKHLREFRAGAFEGKDWKTVIRIKETCK